MKGIVTRKWNLTHLLPSTLWHKTLVTFTKSNKYTSILESKEFLPVEARCGEGLQQKRMAERKKGENMICLLNVHVLSSKCPVDSAVQFVQKQKHLQHFFCQNICCSQLNRSHFHDRKLVEMLIELESLANTTPGSEAAVDAVGILACVPR